MVELFWWHSQTDLGILPILLFPYSTVPFLHLYVFYNGFLKLFSILIINLQNLSLIYNTVKKRQTDKSEGPSPINFGPPNQGPVKSIIIKRNNWLCSCRSHKITDEQQCLHFYTKISVNNSLCGNLSNKRL